MKILLSMAIIFSLSIPDICAGQGTGVSSASSEENTATHLAGAVDPKENFEYDGKPIHPGCVREFEVALADSPPPIVSAVDVKACVTSNEFYMPFTNDDQGYIGYEYDLGDGEKGNFSYKFLGKSDGGIYVLKTRSRGGGTMVAESLFLIKDSFENYWDLDDGNKKTQDRRLIIACIGQITLGDRDGGKVSLKGDHLILGPSQYREKAVTIDIDTERVK